MTDFYPYLYGREYFNIIVFVENKMGTRENRLLSEYESMKRWRSNVVTWEVVGSSKPPDAYLFTYNLKSIVKIDEQGIPYFHTGFKVKVEFKSYYPRSTPEVRLSGKSKPCPV